jgi:hypothetical protein
MASPTSESAETVEAMDKVEVLVRNDIVWENRSK